MLDLRAVATAKDITKSVLKSYLGTDFNSGQTQRDSTFR